MGRRRAIAGLAGAAVAGAGAIAGAEPAAAANGNNVVLGISTNLATAPTGIGVQGTAATYGFGVTDTDSGAIEPRPAILAHAKRNGFGVGNFDTAVYGKAEGQADGLFGEAFGSGIGVRGESWGAGDGGSFVAHGNNYAGVVGSHTGANGTGVLAYGPNPLEIFPWVGLPDPPNGTGFGRKGALRWGGTYPTEHLWLCIETGTPGRWQRVGGPTTAGQLTVLPAPARVYDSRPGTAPTVGAKTKFAANETRTFDLKANSSTVPAGATAALVTLLLVNASTSPGNATIWANGVAKPLANTMVWGGTGGRFTATATTAVDALARVQVNASQPTDLVIDVVGFYR